MDELFEAYRCLLPNNDDIPEEWINKVSTTNGFSEFEPFPEDYLQTLDEETPDELIKLFIESIKQWLSQNDMDLQTINENRDANNPYSWQSLQYKEIDSKKIACILGNHMLQYKSQHSNNSTNLFSALFAAQGYLTLICIPGGNMYSLFNSNLYCLTMETLTNISNLFINKRTVKKRSAEDEEFSTEDDVSTIIRDEEKFLVVFLDILELILIICKTEKFKPENDEFAITIQFLVILCQFEQEVNSFINDLMRKNCSNRRSKTNVAFQSYMLLNRLCGLFDNDVEKAIESVTKAFVLILKEPGAVRNHIIEFFLLLMQNYGKEAGNAMFLLVQNLFFYTPDRAEGRQKILNLIWDLTQWDNATNLKRIIYAAVYMCHFQESKIRLITLDFIGKLLLEPPDLIPMKEPKNINDEFDPFFNFNFLLAVLFHRAQDIAITVRMKALSVLEHVLEKKTMKCLFDDIFVNPFYTNSSKPKNSEAFNRGIFHTHKLLLKECKGPADLPGPKIILEMLNYYTCSGKTFVRNSALKVLSRIYINYGNWIDSKHLQIYFTVCNDTSVLIRKTTVTKMTELLNQYPNRDVLIHYWVKCVIPLSNVDEQRAKERILEVIYHTIFSNLKESRYTTTVQSHLPWKIMKEMIQQRKMEYFDHIVYKHRTILSSPSMLINLFDVLWSHVNKAYDIEAWYILVTLAKLMNLPKIKVVFNHFMELSMDELTNPLMIEVMFWSCRELNKDDKARLLKYFTDHLLIFDIPIRALSRARDICELLVIDAVGPPSKRGAVSRESSTEVISSKKRAAISNWSKPHIKNCQDYILQNLRYENGVRNFEVDEDKLIKCICLYGDLICAAPHLVVDSMDKVLKTELLRDGSKDLKNLDDIKPIIVFTLVKLAMTHEEYVPKLLKIFNGILMSAVAPNLQINIIVGICDLCPRYTSLVEPYLPNICACLKSVYPSVRYTALRCLLNKIRADYILVQRWNMYPLYTLLLDPDPKVQRLINMFMNTHFKSKPVILEKYYPGLFFFLNNSEKDLNALDVDPELMKMFSLENDENKRRTLYLQVLNKLAVDVTQRINVTKRIYNDILAPIVNGSIQFTTKNKNWLVLDDVLYVLYHNEKRISQTIKERSKGTSDNDEMELEEFFEDETGIRVSDTISPTDGVVYTLRSESMRQQLDLNMKLWDKVSNVHGLKESFVRYFAELYRNFSGIGEFYFNDDELEVLVEDCITNSENHEPMEIISNARDQFCSSEIFIDQEVNSPIIPRIEELTIIESECERTTDKNGGELSAIRNRNEQSHDEISSSSIRRTKDSKDRGSTSGESTTSSKSAKKRPMTPENYDSHVPAIHSERSSRIYGRNKNSTPTRCRNESPVAGPSGLSQSFQKRARYNELNRKRYDDLIDRLSNKKNYDKRELVDSD